MAKKPIEFLTIPKLGSLLLVRVDVESFLNEAAFEEMKGLYKKVSLLNWFIVILEFVSYMMIALWRYPKGYYLDVIYSFRNILKF